MSRGTITGLLEALRLGESQAWDQLAPIVYGQLRRQARILLDGKPDSILQPTALVNEVFVRVLAGEDQNWENRRHFYAVCARIMRNVLIDSLRRRQAQKRGGGLSQVPMPEDLPEQSPEWLEDLAEALRSLARVSPRAAQVVEYRFYLGMSEIEIAKLLEVNQKTVQRDWLAARAWLFRFLKPGQTELGNAGYGLT